MKRAGLTLPETILTVFLIALIFGLAASLLKGGFVALRQVSMKERSLVVAQVGLERMTSEVREAYEISSPDTSEQSDLVLFKINPAAGGRFAPATPWDPYQNSLKVRYFVDGDGNLTREVGPKGSPPSTSETIAVGISGMVCKWRGNGNLEIRVSVEESRRLRTLATQVFVPAVEAP